MKKLILIIAALMLISCASTESSFYSDDVTILNSNGDVVKEYDNVSAFILDSADGVCIRTRDGEKFYVLGGIIIVKDR